MKTNEKHSHKLLVDALAEMFSELLYDPQSDQWDDDLKATISGIRALLFNQLNVSSPELQYQRRKDGYAFGDKQSHFNDFLTAMVRHIATDRKDFEQYRDEIFKHYRLRNYSEDHQ